MPLRSGGTKSGKRLGDGMTARKTPRQHLFISGHGWSPPTPAHPRAGYDRRRRAEYRHTATREAKLACSASDSSPIIQKQRTVIRHFELTATITDSPGKSPLHDQTISLSATLSGSAAQLR